MPHTDQMQAEDEASHYINKCDELQKQLEWIWNNCRIVYFPKEQGAYPIEHNPNCKKDGRRWIEPIMKKEIEK